MLITLEMTMWHCLALKLTEIMRSVIFIIAIIIIAMIIIASQAVPLKLVFSWNAKRNLTTIIDQHKEWLSRLDKRFVYHWEYQRLS